MYTREEFHLFFFKFVCWNLFGLFYIFFKEIVNKFFEQSSLFFYGINHIKFFTQETLLELAGCSIIVMCVLGIIKWYVCLVRLLFAWAASTGTKPFHKTLSHLNNPSSFCMDLIAISTQDMKKSLIKIQHW